MAAIRCVFDDRKMKGGTEPPWHHRAPSSRIRRDDAVAAGETPPREPTTQVMRERWRQNGGEGRGRGVRDGESGRKAMGERDEDYDSGEGRYMTVSLSAMVC